MRLGGGVPEAGLPVDDPVVGLVEAAFFINVTFMALFVIATPGR